MNNTGYIPILQLSNVTNYRPFKYDDETKRHLSIYAVMETFKDFGKRLKYEVLELERCPKSLFEKDGLYSKY